MAVTLAPTALARVQRYLVESPDAIGLRFGVTRTGCSGWSGERLDVGWAIDVLHPFATGERDSVRPIDIESIE